MHRMAHFHMYSQIKKQSLAFIKGFHSVIDKSFVAFFSPQELQHLISGGQGELDVDDLRYLRDVGVACLCVCGGRGGGVAGSARHRFVCMLTF